MKHAKAHNPYQDVNYVYCTGMLSIIKTITWVHHPSKICLRLPAIYVHVSVISLSVGFLPITKGALDRLYIELYFNDNHVQGYLELHWLAATKLHIKKQYSEGDYRDCKISTE